jgi:hypothetical protein
MSEGLALVSARTETEWFEVALVPVFSPGLVIRGRLHFFGWSNGAPFPSALIYCGRRHNRFVRQFGDLGLIAQFTKSTPPQLIPFAELVETAGG